MAMGYYGIQVVHIKDEDIKKIVPKEFFNLKSFAEKSGLTLNDVAIAEHYNDALKTTINIEEKVFNLLESLYIAFKEKTEIGLYLAYHDNLNYGSAYDEIDGYYFALDWGDIYTFTPAAKLLQKLGVDFEDKDFVVYG